MSSSIQARPSLEKKQLLNDTEYREAQEKWGRDAFVAKMGGEAIRDLLQTEDLQSLLLDLKEKLRKTKSQQARMKLAKRLKDRRKLCLLWQQARMDGDVRSFPSSHPICALSFLSMAAVLRHPT